MDARTPLHDRRQSGTVRPAAPAEIPVLAGVLARAFGADPMTVWPLVSGDALAERIRMTFEIVDTRFAGEGWIYTAGEGLGVMSLLPPAIGEREREIADAIAPAIASLTLDGGERYERFWAWVWSMTEPEPHWLLDQIAVEPAAQGRGIGGAMLRFAIELAEQHGLPLCLETGVAGNVPLYEHFGFRVLSEADAPDGGPHIWFMRRDPVFAKTACRDPEPSQPSRCSHRRSYPGPQCGAPSLYTQAAATT